MKQFKTMIILFTIILCILLINILFTVSEIFDYEDRKKSGNERWQQVENKILQTEKKVNTLEEDIIKWKN